MTAIFLVALCVAQVVPYGNRVYSGPVCNNPRCRMCQIIRQRQAAARQPVTIVKTVATPAPSKPAGLANLSSSAMTDALAALELRADDTFVDVGCGDGRVLLEAVRRYHCRAVGVEIDGPTYRRAKAAVAAAEAAGTIPPGSVDLIQGDAADFDPTAWGVTKGLAYLFPETLTALRTTLDAIPTVVVPFHDIPGAEPTHLFRQDFRVYVRQWTPRAAALVALQPAALPQRVLVVVTDPAICAPCRRLDGELAKLSGVALVRVPKLRGTQTIPTLIYYGSRLTGYHDAEAINAWITNTEKRCN